MSSGTAVGAAPAWVCAQASGEPADVSESTLIASGTLVGVIASADFPSCGCVSCFVRVLYWRAEARGDCWTVTKGIHAMASLIWVVV